MTHPIIHRFTITGLEGDKIINLKATGTFIIGRQSGVDIHLKQALISRKHAQLDCTETTCQITDLKSANGVIIDGQRIPANQAITLNDTMRIEIGAFHLHYELVQGAPSSPGVSIVESTPKRPFRPISPAADIIAIGPPPIPPSNNGQLPAPQANGHYYYPPPGLLLTKSRYLQYLPSIYQPIYRPDGQGGLKETNYFIARLLALCESILEPIRWTTENFDLFLSPTTVPKEFLSWLATWFDLIFDESWSEEQQRQLLSEAHEIFAYRGTQKSLNRLLEIYTTPFSDEAITIDIDDEHPDLPPFTFSVTISLPETETHRLLIERLINAHKPAHTNYTLRLTG